MFNDKVILITGGTGSFGKKFLEMTLKNYNPKKIIIFSRDEMKQWDLSQKYLDEDKIRFFIGDVRDDKGYTEHLMASILLFMQQPLRLYPLQNITLLNVSKPM